MSAVLSALENIQCRVAYLPGANDPSSTTVCVLQYVAVRCIVLQRLPFCKEPATAALSWRVCCSALQCVAVRCLFAGSQEPLLYHRVSCSVLQRVAAVACLRGASDGCSIAVCIFSHTAAHCNTMQHGTPHCNPLQHAATTEMPVCLEPVPPYVVVCASV